MKNPHSVRFFVAVFSFFVIASITHSASAATGPEVSISNDEDTIIITEDPADFDTEIHTISYSDAQDLQAMRVLRDNKYYIVVAIKKSDVIRLRFYTKKGEEIASRRVFWLEDGQGFGSMKMDKQTKGDSDVVRVRVVKLNKENKPIRLLKKQYYMRPSGSPILKGAGSTVKTIEYPTLSGLTDDEAGLTIFNYQRLAAGILPVTRSSILDHGCALHAEYMRFNNELSHSEDATKPGYTEEGAAAGMSSNLAGSYKNSSIVYAIEVLTTAIYHRLPMISNQLHTIGWDVSSTSSQGYNYACMNVQDGKDYGELTTNSQEDNITVYDPYNHEPIAYPGVGQEHIPSTFDTGELPDPIDAFGGSYPVGQPISLTFSNNDTVSNMAMSVKDFTGASISGYFRAPDDSTDPNNLYQGNAVTFIAKSPLRSGTTYTATVTGKVNNDSFTKTWSFTTQ